MSNKEPHHLLFTADMHENAQTHTMCTLCGAPVGEPCINNTGDRLKTGTVHAHRLNNYGTWLKRYHTNYRREA
jgi:hypothetical protein